MKTGTPGALTVALLLVLWAANARAQNAPDASDPFGSEDPFAVLGEKAPPTSADPPRADRVKLEGSVFLKNVNNDINQDSRINPGNRALQLEKQSQIYETRLTLSQSLDEAQQWRWLFKGFASNASYIDQYGMANQGGRVDELFVDWKGDGWFANLGKRRLNWGHAQGFNPVNVVVPPRDPTNPGRETEGQPMLWVNKSSGAQSVDVLATRNYDRNYASDQNRWGAKWSYTAEKIDYALYYFDGAAYSDGRAYERMLGASFSADVYPGITAYMEAANFARNYRSYYNAAGQSSVRPGAYWQIVLGSTFNLGGKRRFGLEYYRNEQGNSEAQSVNYFATADQQLASGLPTGIATEYRVTGMSRDYLLLSYQDEWSERYSANLSALVAADSSYALRAQMNYASSDYYELRVVLLHNQGGRASEFGNSPVSNALELWLGVNF